MRVSWWFLEMHLNEVRIGEESVEKFVSTPELHKMFHGEPWNDFQDELIREHDRWRRRRHQFFFNWAVILLFKFNNPSCRSKVWERIWICASINSSKQLSSAFEIPFFFLYFFAKKVLLGVLKNKKTRVLYVKKMQTRVLWSL